MRIAFTLLPAVLLAACGDDPATSSFTTAITAGATETGGTTPDPTGVTGSITNTPTSGSMTGGMTGSGTTVGPGEVTDSSTSPVQTDTGPLATTGDATTTNATTGDATTTNDTTSESEGTSTGGGEDCACPNIEVPLDDGIFVLSLDAALWKYFPETNDIVLLGTPKCDLQEPAFSMAVDRLGFAWMQFASGALRKVSVSNLNACTNPGYVPNQQGITTFGMAFVSNSATDKCDRIFGDQYNGIPEGPKVADFFSIDPATQKIVKLGKSDFGTAEVTGTGDGRAFLFAPANLAKLVEVDKQTGATIGAVPLPGVTAGGGWAFAFFAGDFYFFTDDESDGASEVTHLDYDDSDNNGKQDLTVILENVPLTIVGAGVSTCAPTAPQ